MNFIDLIIVQIILIDLMCKLINMRKNLTFH